MSIPPLVGLAAAAATPLINSAAQGLAEGASSFLDLLTESPAEPAEAKADKEKQAEDRSVLDFILGPRHVPGETLGRLRMDRLQERLEAALQILPGKIRERLDAAGIDSSQPLELKLDHAGAVRVSGDHPHREAVEQALAGDRDIQQLLAFSSSTTSIMQAGKRHIEFAKAYEEDPEAAVAAFFPLPDLPEIRFSIDGDEATILTD